MKRFFSLPVTDTLFGLDRCMAGGWKALALVSLGLIGGWWIYVPIHELLHAAACMATGGTVDRLEIDPIYLGEVLASAIPWVEAGGEYAGRLSGFDTGGNDAIYLATVFGPYLLTLFPGVWWLRKAAQRQSSLFFGMSLPVALGPFISVTGDAYEIGSILTTLVGPWSSAASQELLRGDDVFLKVRQLADAGSGGAWAAFVVAAALGLLWAFATYRAGAWLADRLHQEAVQDPREDAS